MLGLAIPLYDEEACCEQVTLDLLAALKAAHIPARLALVDNGSSDRTTELVNRLAVAHDAVTAVHLEQNAGYGGGILAGLRALDTPFLGWCWGDGQVDAAVVVAAWRKLRAGRFELVKARRVERQDGRQRQLVTTLYNTLMRAAFALPTGDVNGCPKLFTRDAWERLDLRSTDWFLDPELMLKAQALGLRWAEVDAVMRPRPGGASKVRRETMVEFARRLWAWKRGWRP
ncbi:MAG: glycosyltransferase family 2 protein [Alphaproteobacteria bacterium]|nr:glycosyltransferase family 2 protein [Alphaproteobacteria bacterium]